MTLFSMALNNIKNNFKNYWTFFLSSTFSVFVLYLFISIVNNNGIKAELGGKQTFIILFSMGSYIIAIFSGFFIWYSNSFLIKSRKKEFALYMMLGMSKKQTARLSFIENLITIVSAFCAGVILGLIFNKFFIMLLYVMIGVTGDVEFQFSLQAFKLCSIVFGFMFIVISIHSSILIYRNNLIDLFNASKKLERGLKVSSITVLILLFSIAFLGVGYYLAVKKLATNIFLGPLIVILVVIGTILIFSGVTSFIIYVNKKNEKSLFKGTKLISISQISYRYRGNIGTLSVIAVTTTIALCAMVTCFGLFDKAEELSRNVIPFSVEYINGTDCIDRSFEDTLKNHKEISVKYKDNIEFVQVNANNPFRGDIDTFFILNESEFNKIRNHEGIDRKVNLINDIDCYFIQRANFVPDKSIIGKAVKLNSEDKEYDLKILDTDMKCPIASEHFKETFVVKESIYDQIKSTTSKKSIFNITGYILRNDFLSKSFIMDLKEKIPSENSLLTFYENYTNGLQSLGIMGFIGVFLGIVFLTATGSIIYFKMVMEAQEDKNKFITLRKIGVSKAEIKNAISKELMILFGLPFIMALINTYAASITLGEMMGIKMNKSFIVIILVYALLYGVYYLITLNSYIKTIDE